MMFFLICITVFSMSGVPAWPSHINSVGYFKLSSNTWGTALYQDGLHSTLQFNGFLKTSVRDRTVILVRNRNKPANIDFSRDDIIFDSEGNVYTESKENEMRTIYYQSGISVIRFYTDNRLSVPAHDFVYIINPHIPGVIALQFPTSTTVSIDLERKTIEFPKTVSQITVHVYDTMPKFVKHL